MLTWNVRDAHLSAFRGHSLLQQATPSHSARQYTDQHAFQAGKVLPKKQSLGQSEYFSMLSASDSRATGEVSLYSSCSVCAGLSQLKARQPEGQLHPSYLLETMLCRCI